MVEAELKTRQQKFQQVLDGASDMFLMWAAHRFYVEAKERFIAVPWDENPGAVYSKTEAKQPIASPKQETTTILSNIGNVTVSSSFGILPLENTPQPPGVVLNNMNKMYGTKFSEWLPVIDAPIVKKKAYNPISMHMKTGQFVMYEATQYATHKKVMRYAKIMGFTKFSVKLAVYGAGFAKSVAKYEAIKMVSC